MKLFIPTFYTLVFTLIVSNIFGQNRNNYLKLSHTITTETKAITGFDKIDVSEDFEVFIRFSDNEEKIAIEANENLHNLIQVEKQGTTLKIYTKSYSTAGHNHGVDEKLVAYITAKNLSEIKGDEDVVINFENKLDTDNLTIYLVEDSTLKGHLDVENLKVELDEDSVLNISGSAKEMNVAANEDSMIKSFDFIVDNLEIELSEESEAKLTVNGDINLKATGESTFHYRGDGNFVSKRVRGESEVKSW